MSVYKINSEFKTNPTPEYYIGIKLLDFLSFYPNQATIKRIRLMTKKKSVQLLQRMIDYSREVVRYQKSESSYSVVYELWSLFNNLRQQRHTIRVVLHIDERICSKLIKRESSISTSDKPNGSYWRFWSCPVISRVRTLVVIWFVFFWRSTDPRANYILTAATRDQNSLRSFLIGRIIHVLFNVILNILSSEYDTYQIFIGGSYTYRVTFISEIINYLLILSVVSTGLQIPRSKTLYCKGTTSDLTMIIYGSLYSVLISGNKSCRFQIYWRLSRFLVMSVVLIDAKSRLTWFDLRINW